MSTSTITAAAHKSADGHSILWRVSLRPAIVALTAAGMVFLLADAITGGLLARQGSAAPEPVLLPNVLGAAFIGSLAAVAIAYATRRFGSRPRGTFVAITAGGTMLYSVMPFVATEDLTSALVLVLLHLVVAVPLIAGLASVLPDSR